MKIDTSRLPARRLVETQVVDSIGRTVGNMTEQTRQAVQEEALRNWGSTGAYRLSRVVSKNLRIPEPVVEGVFIACWLEERSRRAALETGLRGALQMSIEAGREAREELRGAA